MAITAIIAGGVMAGTGAMSGMLGANQPEPPKSPRSTAPPLVTTQAKTDEQKALRDANKRRQLYANVGRSSTILTGPDGLDAPPVDQAAPKTLLGL